ncbi:MAG: hypothetical protein LR011_08915 [Verrucomicrobia bacterium]|nr:hypothetical protein [Verrucomicrobiota bacterium]
MILAVGLLPLAFAVRGLSSFFNVYLINYTGLRVLEDIRCQLFTKIQNLDITFFTSHSQGDLMSRLFNDTSQLQVSVVNVANDLIKQPVTFLGAMGFLIFKSIEKSEIIFILFSLAIIPVCVLPIRFAGKKLLKKALQMQQQTGKANALVQENLAGYREIRSFNLQNREKSRFLVTIRDLFREQMKIVKYSSFLSPLIEFISAIGISMAIFYAAGKGITLEDFTPLIMALYLSYEPIKKLGPIHNQIKKRRRLPWIALRKFSTNRKKSSALKIPDHFHQLSSRSSSITCILNIHPETRSLRASISRRSWGNPSPWLGQAGLENPPWPSSCAAFLIRPVARSGSMESISGNSILWF